MNKALISIIFLLMSISVCLGQNGWLSGTAVYVGGKPDEASEAANITVVLRTKHTNVFVKTDSIGDFYNTPMRQGKYCLVSAKRADGLILKFAPRQIRCFRIRSDKELRFDIMLLKEDTGGSAESSLYGPARPSLIGKDHFLADAAQA